MKIYVASFLDRNTMTSEVLDRASNQLEGAQEIAQELADDWAGMSSIEPETLTWEYDRGSSLGRQRWKADCGDTEMYVDELDLV